MRHLAALIAFVAALSTPPVAAQTIAIVHARVWTMTQDTPIEDATVVMAGVRIGSVVAHGPVPPGARIVDAAGRTVTPGLINGATQLGLVEVLEVGDTADQSVTSGPLGPAFDVSYAINANSTLIPIARADGLTRAMVLPGGAATPPFAGSGALIHLLDAPSLVEKRRAAMLALIGDASLAKAGGSRAAQWGLLRNALDEARRFRIARVSGPRDQLLNHADIVALGSVLARETPLAIAVDRESDIRQAIALAADEKVKVVIVGGAEAWRAADALAAAHIPVVLDPQADLPQTFDALGARSDNAAILARSGVPIAFSVSGNGIYLSYDAGLELREGAGLAVANGLPYPAALRAITTAAASIWGWPPDTGALTPGSDADLVIWDGDPLEPASAPTAVFVAGRETSLVTRQTLLARRYAPARTGDPLPPAYR